MIGNNTKKDINFLYNLAFKRGGKCLSSEYITIKTHYMWKCNICLNEWSARADHVNRGSWCGKCFYVKLSNIKTRINGLDFLQKIANKNQGKCLSTSYIRSDSKYKWLCETCKYEWFAVANSIKAGHWCPKCNESRGEKSINQYLQSLGFQLNIDYYREFKFNDCLYKRKLPFDFFIPKMNIIIEFDGSHHFNEKVGYSSRHNLKEVQIKDKIKNQYCYINNIKLIRIPYSKLKNIPTILGKELT